MAVQPLGDCGHAEVPRPQACAHHVECSTRDASHSRSSRAWSGLSSPWRQADRSPLAGLRMTMRDSGHLVTVAGILLQPAPVSSKPFCAGYQPARAPSRGHSKPLRAALLANALSRRRPERPEPLSSRALQGICWPWIPRRPLFSRRLGVPALALWALRSSGSCPDSGRKWVSRRAPRTGESDHTGKPTSPAGALRLSPCADLPTNPPTCIIGA